MDIPILLGQMEDDDAALVIQLLKEDGATAVNTLPGKNGQVEGPETDGGLALRLFIEELNAAQTFVSDRRISRGLQNPDLQNPGQQDRAARLRAQDDESALRARRARDLALRAERLPTRPTTQAATTSNTTAVAAAASPSTTNTAPETKKNPVGNPASTNTAFGASKLESKEASVPASKVVKPDDQNDETKVSAQPESSASAASTKLKQEEEKPAENPETPPPSVEQRSCEACRACEDVEDLSKVPCGHEYCRGCLATIFRGAMEDESYFPPRCCKQPIPMDAHNRRFLADNELAGGFKRKAVEFTTPNRTYCHMPICAAFIPPRSPGSLIPTTTTTTTTTKSSSAATCMKCFTQTCTTCKKAAHPGQECPNDLELQQVLALAKQQGWQRCKKCQVMVELRTGCNHITCRCGSEFCYVCGKQWKTCNCVHWEEQRLYERAQAINARPVQPQQPGAANNDNRPAGVGAIMRDLRRNHECKHWSWLKVNRAHRCEECHDDMPNFIFECRQCHIMACWRCRQHRL